MSDHAKTISAVERFCDPDAGSRYPGLTRPWAVSGRLWATDGRALAAVPLDAIEASECDWKPVGKVPQRIEELLPSLADYSAPVPIPDPGPETRVPCDECDGLGAFRIAKGGHAVNCRWEPDKGNQYQCPTCDGLGYDIADEPPVTLGQVGDRPFAVAARYARLLREIGVTEVMLPPRHGEVCVGQVGPIAVILMPLAPDHDRKGGLP